MSQDGRVGTVLDGRYRLLGVAREGRSSTTYDAERVADHQPLLVKVLQARDSTDAEMATLRAEASIGARLPHPGIVVPNAVLKTSEGTPYIVYDRPSGEDLARRLGHTPRLPVWEAGAIVQQVADAIHAAHLAGVAHGDLRPSTIVIEGPGAPGGVRVTDYGFASMRDARRLAARQSTSGRGLMGAASYMAPEQAEGKPADAKSDQFALAAIVFEMLVGQSPFGTGSTVAILSRVLHANPPPMIGVSRSIERVVLRGLAKRPEARFESVGAFAAAFAEALQRGDSARGDSGATPTVPVEPVPIAPARYQRTEAMPTALPPPSSTRPTAPPVRAPQPEAEEPLLPARSALLPRWWPWPVAVTMFVVTLATALHFVRAGSDTAPPTAAPPAATVLIKLHVVPPQAEVRIDDRLVASRELWLPRGGAPLHLLASAEGYLPASRELVPDSDQSLAIILTSSAAPLAPPKTPPRAPAKAPPARRPPPGEAAAAPSLNDLRDPFEK